MPDRVQRRRQEIAPRSRALVLAAIAFNAALVLLVAFVGDASDVLYILVFGAPPVLLLTVVKYPLLFRTLTGLLGLAYLVWTAATFFVIGGIFAPTGFLLLAAALCFSPRTQRPDQRAHTTAPHSTTGP